LNRRQLKALYHYFGRRFGVTIVGPGDCEPLLAASAPEMLTYLERRLSLGDAWVAHAVDSWARETEVFVSWDARHFRGKIAPRALTPREFLREG
jgi:hypothetical protein